MRIWLWLLLACFSAGALAAIETHEFNNPIDETRYRELINELRCPKCQNQNIADSNAPLAQDLRQKVYEQINQGYSDQQIMDYMVARYGDFVTYRPPLRPSTWLLWFGPLAVVMIAGLAIWLWLRQRPPPAAPLDHTQQQRLQALLAEDDEDSR